MAGTTPLAVVDTLTGMLTGMVDPTALVGTPEVVVVNTRTRMLALARTLAYISKIPHDPSVDFFCLIFGCCVA